MTRSSNTISGGPTQWPKERFKAALGRYLDREEDWALFELPLRPTDSGRPCES